MQSTYGTVDTAKIAILLYALLKLQRGAHYIFNVVWGNVFYYGRSLTLACVGQTRWQRPGETVSEHRRKVSACQALRLRPEKTSEVKS